MIASLVRTSLLGSVALLAIGCGCRQDYDLVAPIDNSPEADWGQWLSMDTTPDGRLAITYYTTDQNGSIRFAAGSPRSDGSVVWDHEDVDGGPVDGLNPGDRGKYTSMRVAESGTVWASYHDEALGTLRVAQRVSPDNWVSDVADQGGGLAPKYGMWSSLDLDADEHPVVAHYDGDKQELRVAHFDGEAWSAETIDQGQDNIYVDPETAETITVDADVGKYAKIMIHDGTEYIAYYDAAYGTLKLAEGFAGAYTTSVIYDVQGVDAGQWPDLWTDGTSLVVTFQDVTNQDLIMGTRTGGVWTFETIDDSIFAGADTEVVQKDGDFAVVYFDGHNNDMRLAERVSGAWETTRLGGTNAAVGFHNEITQAGDGTWWVASFDYTNRNLFVRPID
ncbi:MAG: hypothetical protein EP330_23605 [Deltaproteobacteria bacterium]|nr:MAG: hypothetical protein EP330_23605 [Deltaproteobacteria bacterium]